MNTLLRQYKNGNASVAIYNDGTRVIDTNEENIFLEYPFNIDIRLSRKCAFGLNTGTGKAICDFCHESATTDGKDADIDKLVEVLSPIPAGVELAVGVNQFDYNVSLFLSIAKTRGWIVNTTINQGLIHRDRLMVRQALSDGLINGLGISYRKGMKMPDAEFVDYDNTVFHVIAGLDNFDDVLALSKSGVKKILVLGEKDFGFNVGKVKLKSESHFWWYRRIHELFKHFEIVSFDNLGVEQLNVKRFVKDWETTFQHEYSMYINAVDGYFSPSSRSLDQTKWNHTDILTYFKEAVIDHA